MEEEYRTQYPSFDIFTKRLQQLLETILKSSNINFHLVESRTKSVESFCEKVKRKQDKYINPLKEITDICATRIIVYYIDDLDKVEKVLRENLLIDEANSYYAKNNMTDNEFGYLSSHFVISLKEDRSKLPEWSPYKEQKMEIQVRTVLQHSWASISHELEYKKNYEIPSILKRKLYRLASLIELADEEFQEAREKHLAVELAIKNNEPLYDQKVNEEINLNTLKNYLLKNPEITNQFNQLGKQAGFNIEDVRFSQSEKNKSISEIIKFCEIKGIITIQEFDNYIHQISEKSLKRLEHLYKKENIGWTASSEFILLISLLMSLNYQQFSKFDNLDWSKKTLETIGEIASIN
jgi:GTP pyrophosphokinase